MKMKKPLAKRWSVRVVSDWQEGIAEVGRSSNGVNLVKVLASTNKETGVAHISLEDARELRRALSRAIREIEAGLPEPKKSGLTPNAKHVS